MSDDLDNFNNYQRRLFELNNQRRTVIDEKINTLYRAGLDASFISAGWGEHNRQVINNFSKLNRFGTRFVMDNYIRTGYTFITRPELNLSTPNLRTNRIMNLLRNDDPTSIQFMIRAYLDTRYARYHALDRVLQSPFIDHHNPFFVLLSNNLTELSGGPTYQMEVFTEEGGFYGESQSMAIGSDSYKKPFDLQLSFIDPAGGPIDAVMKFWTKYMELINTGEMIMYPDQESERIMNYTVSIYRFMMDPSFRYIKKWVKYTGCFPINHQGASVFDFNTGNVYVDALRKFSIGFRCAGGASDPEDPIVIKEFNDLVERWFPTIRCLRPHKRYRGNGDTPINTMLVPADQIVPTLKSNNLIMNPILPEFNYSGVPYILDTENGPRLDVFSESGELNDKKHLLAYENDRFVNYYPEMKTAANLLEPDVQKLDMDIAELFNNYETARSEKIASKTAVYV